MTLAFAFISVFFSYSQSYVAVPFAVVVSTLISIFLQRFVVFRKFRYRDYMRVLVYTIIRFVFYSLGLWVFKLFIPYIPLFVSFNLIAIVMIPLEYLMHKLLYLSRYHDVNKER